MESQQQKNQTGADQDGVKEQILAEKRRRLKDLMSESGDFGPQMPDPNRHGNPMGHPAGSGPSGFAVNAPPGATNAHFEAGGPHAGFNPDEFLKWAQQQAENNNSGGQQQAAGGNPFIDFWRQMGFNPPSDGNHFVPPFPKPGQSDPAQQNGNQANPFTEFWQKMGVNMPTGNPFFPPPFGMPGMPSAGQPGGFGPMADWMKAFNANQAPGPNPSSNAPPVSPLVTMRSGGSKTPFFCVHALLGSVFHYHRLSNLLDADQPFYGLQARGLDGLEKPLEKLEDFAALYLTLIKQVQPKGPYKLGGYSFGAWVAYEMALELLQAGEQVQLLFIMGTSVPYANYIPIMENMEFVEKYMEDYKSQMLDPFLSYEQRMAGGFRQMENQLTPLQRIYLAHHLAMLRYVAKPLNGKVTLLETAEQQAWASYDYTGGWKRLATQGLEQHLISGNHLSMLEEPHIEEVAKLLTASLAKD